jgi:hypothetical protein
MEPDPFMGQHFDRFHRLALAVLGQHGAEEASHIGL